MKNTFSCSNPCFFILLLFMFFVLVVSCSNSTHHKTNSGNRKKDNTIRLKPPSSFNDTIKIDFPSAVFYEPDSLQLEKIKAVTDTMIFESIMHDCFYQMSYSRKVLQKNWPKIKIVEISNVRYILFKTEKLISEFIDLNTENDPCGIFLFDARKKPQLADMTNMDSELARYFAQ